jgi:Bacterial Ig-like domain (group 2)
MANNATKGRGKQSFAGLAEVPPSSKRTPDEGIITTGEQAINLPPPLTILPDNPGLAVGETRQFKAHPTNGKERSMTHKWESSNSKVLSISATGLARGVSEGAVTISVSSGDAKGTLDLEVTPAQLKSIDVSPTNKSLAAGNSQQFTATGTYSDDSTNTLKNVTWTSSATAVAAIDSSGSAKGLTVGSSTITATSGRLTGDTTLTVSPPQVESIAVSSKRPWVGAGQTRRFTATATLSDGKTKDVTQHATWRSTDSSVATITGPGIVTGLTFGSTEITAKYEDPRGKILRDETQLRVLVNFNMGGEDTLAFMNARSSVNQLLTAFERRGNLADVEVAQLQDGLELVTQFVNNNPDTPIPNFNSASKAGNSESDLKQLGIEFNVNGKVGTGSGKSNVIDDRFRAICTYLYNGRQPAGLEHDPGSFPPENGSNPGGLTDEQLRVAAIYGHVQNSMATPPPYIAEESPLLPDDRSRRDTFNLAVQAADVHFRTNRALYVASLARLLELSQTPQIDVSDWSKVVNLLVEQGISATNPQLNTWIDRALATAQNVGQDAKPSEITINLPDLEKDVSNFEIVSENIFALQPAYFCSMLEELKVFQVVEKLVELFQNGVLPVVKGTAGNLLFAWWKNAALRVSEAERRAFYARSLGFPGGDADSPNREFRDLFMRFVSAVSSFVRQNTVDDLLRSKIPAAISQQQVRKSARDLATNISSHGYGIAYPMATELQKEINEAMAILRNNEIQNAYGAKDVWQLVDQVAGLELGGARNSVKYRTMASAGATVFAWLAQKGKVLASNSYVPILDITQLQLPPSYSSNATTKPSDFDLVGACDQWLAVTGTQEDSVEQAAQPVESPIMPSRPIQIPSVARDMLESVGVPAMGYSAVPGKTNGATYNWRSK